MTRKDSQGDAQVEKEINATEEEQKQTLKKKLSGAQARRMAKKNAKDEKEIAARVGQIQNIDTATLTSTPQKPSLNPQTSQKATGNS